MISIIVCSRNNRNNSILEHIISSTIGLKHETIIINNAQGSHSIFSAYNLGISQAKGDILCFMHDDICFHTNNWGRIVKDIFEDDSIGLLGVIGSKLLMSDVSWWLSGNTVGEYIQGANDKGIYHCSKEGKSINAIVEDVALVDGFWFCMPKRVCNLIRFDNINYSGFHCYDLDISMQIHEIGKRVVVTTSILIEHKSMGVLNASYYSQLDVFSKKWQSHLPIIIGNNTDIIDFDQYLSILSSYQRSERKANLIIRSHAYRIGSFLMKPVKLIKRLIK